MGETVQKGFNYLSKIILATAVLFGIVYQGGYGQSVQPGDIVISEFMADPAANSDADGEYIELYNRRAIPINIDGYKLSDDGTNSHLIDNNGTLSIPGESFLVIAKSADPAGDGSVTPDYIFDSFGLTNSGDQIILTNTKGKEIARLNYTSTSAGISSELNDVENVDRSGQTSEDDYVDAQSTFGNGDKGSPGSAGQTNMTESPKVRFLLTESTISEGSSTRSVTVLLQDPDGSEVTVEVELQTAASTADESDFTENSSVTVTFSSSAADGEEKTLFEPKGDNKFEGAEKAVFTLKNVSTSGAAEIGFPNTSTVTIKDDDKPKIVINEFLADPPSGISGDANGNGIRDGEDEEFIELVNNSLKDVDISGWRLSDNGTDSRHTFPEGTVLPANRAIVVFGGSGPDYPIGNFGGALVQATSSLGLNNDGDVITLLDDEGNVVQKVAYGNEGGVDTEAQAITRDVDITGEFVAHSNSSNSQGALFSPGTKVDGSPFGTDHAIAFRGTEGWRMVSSPVQNATFNDLFSELWIQGVSGSDDPSGDGTLFNWDESAPGFSPVQNMSDNLTPGKGYIVYVFEDNEYSTPGMQGGFPKIIDVNGSENNNTVSISVSANDSDGEQGINGNEGWNMLGNPFDADLSVSAILDALEAANSSVNANIYVWDHDAGGGNGSWITKDDGDLLAPFQGYFVKFQSEFNSTQVDFEKNSLEANEGTEFYKKSSEPILFDLQLHGEQYFDTYSLEFSENGRTDLDRHDAFKLFSLNSNSINLFSTINSNRMQKNVLPKELESNVEIPLSFDVSGRNKLVFKWNSSFNNIPNDWDFVLVDKEQNREIDLRRTEEYSFQLTSQTSNETTSNQQENRLLNKATEKEGESRFVLSVRPNGLAQTANQLPEDIKLEPNYPNPFNPSTTIPYEITEDSEVKLTVWNMIGQKVATLVDGIVEAGSHEETWNASDMPSGIYIARFEVNGAVFTRKMTLIK